MNRLNQIVAALLLPLVLAACGSDSTGASDDRPQAERTLPVQALEVQPRDLSRVVQISSPVEPLRTIRLASRTDGILTEVAVEEGDAVEQGQVVARIDVSEQQAELARARAGLNEKRANYERLERLKERNYIDEATYVTSRAELEVAESEVELWRTRVDFGIVRSSIDGTVVTRYVEPGEAVTRHEPLFSLADLSALVVRLGVSELDVRNLRVNQPVVLRVDAVADHNPLPGVIRRIFPAAEADSRLITVEVEIPDAGEKGVRPGYLARAEILVDSREEALAVPAGSVAESDGVFYVLVINDQDRLERRTVEPGIIRGSWREILDGLESGDRIVSANPREMTEGEKVRIVDWAG